MLSLRLPTTVALLTALCTPVWPLSVAMPRVANSFFTDEAVRLTVNAEAPRHRVTYTVRDYWNVTRREGFLSAGGAPTMLLLGRLPVGWYRLSLQDSSTALEDCFCVLPRPYEDPGDYDLFALHPGDGATEENLSAATQMGVRLIRQNIPWPTFEPERGVWNTEILDTWTGLGRKYGVQMMFVLGFSPRFIGQKPENYLDDWVNAAWFTWHPSEPNEWGEYLDRVTAYLRGMSVQWPSPHVSSAGSPPAPRQLPIAHSWELWNEADICFYVGDWGRYNDLLHMGWAAGRRRLPDTPMIYGGSTGNFIAMGVTASGSARYCFDYIALHTGGDLEDALRVWYGGAQQIPWVVGAPRETVHTECYAQGRRGAVPLEQWRETPAELRRCYLTLKAWREVAYYRSGCLGGWIREEGVMAPGTSMLVRHGDHLCPTPLYPAFAATRKLLSDATEVGPVDLGQNVTAHVFLKHGKVLLAAWSDDGALVQIALARGAYELDVFGGRHPLKSQSSVHRRLGPEPVVILGADPAAYLGQALRRRYDLLAQTPYGTTQINPDCRVWYARPLNVDLGNLLGSGAATRLGGFVRKAARTLATSASRGPAALLTAQNAVSQTMRQVVAVCPPGEELPAKAADALWRLARLGEWLGEVADDRSQVWEDLIVPDAELAALQESLQAARRRLATTRPDADLPCALQLLDRATRQLPRLEQQRRRGTFQAVQQKVQVAELLLAVEKPVVLRVVPIVDFTTARCFRKARLLEPGETHTVNVWVYNYLEHTVSGSLNLQFPASWSPASAVVPFRADAGRPSASVAVHVTLPDNPTPWNAVQSFTMDGTVNLSLPAGLSDRPTVDIHGMLDSGAELAPMTHWVNVGKWLDEASSPKSVSAPPPQVQAKLRLLEAQLQPRPRRRQP